jgi:uncharacterized protein YeaO (DUF488 family)
MAHRRTDNLRVRRVYEDPAPDDGRRVLVDRLWPRGLSNELRHWYHEAPAMRHTEFVVKFEAELDNPAAHDAMQRLRSALREGPVTLLTAVKDVPGSHVEVLLGHLRTPE